MTEPQHPTHEEIRDAINGAVFTGEEFDCIGGPFDGTRVAVDIAEFVVDGVPGRYAHKVVYLWEPEEAP